MTTRIATTIDVLTPSYNYRRYLGDTLISVRQQLPRNGRHIIVDGGSLDGTVELLTQQDDPLLLWRSTPDAGQSDALNRGLSQTTAEWVGWLNADEFYLQDALASVDQFVASSVDHVDVVYGDCAFVDDEGRFLRLLPAHQFSSLALRAYGCFLPSCATFVRRELLERVGWSEDFRRAMDWHLWLRLDDIGARFQYLPRTLACFRIHAAQVTATPESEDADEFERLNPLRSLPTRGVYVRATRLMGRMAHVALKMRSRGYSRQVKAAAKLRNADLRWWLDHQQSVSAQWLRDL